MFTAIQRGQSHLAMRHHRRHYANQIDVVPVNNSTPVVFYMRNVELARDFFSMVAMRAGNRHDARAFAILESGNLRRAGEAGADDSDANDVFHSLEERQSTTFMEKSRNNPKFEVEPPQRFELRKPRDYETR